MVFKKIREHKEYIQDAASWFQAKWDIPQEEYLKSMNESLLKETSIPHCNAIILYYFSYYQLVMYHCKIDE